MAAPRISLFDPNVPLALWDEIPAADLESGAPVQHGHYYLPPDAYGMQAGVWDCTAMTTRAGPYSVNEFMLILEGEVHMLEADGTRTAIGPGESFIIPKGTDCQWIQPGYVRKFFVIFDDPSGKLVEPAARRVIKIDPKAPLAPADAPDPATLIGPAPEWRDNTLFTDATGQWTVGIWHSTPFHRQPGPINRHELMHLLEGAVTLPDGEGGTKRYAAGDSFLVPLAAHYEWDSAEPVKKIFCSFTPG